MNENLAVENGLAIVTCYSDEKFEQVEQWIEYHKSLVGYRNLHLLQFGEKNPTRKKLSPLIKQGLQFFGPHPSAIFSFSKPLDRTNRLSQYFEDLASCPPFKLAVYLDLSEFLVFNGAQGIGASSTWIREEIQRLLNSGHTIPIQWGFDRHPVQTGAFQYAPKRRWIVSANDLLQAGPSWMDEDFSKNDLPHASTALQLLSTACHGSENTDVIASTGTSTSTSTSQLALFSHNLSALSASSQPVQHLPPDHAPRYRFDLDGSAAFKPETYLGYHNDVQVAGMDALAHFVQFGYLEGRPVGDSPDAWRELYDRLDSIRAIQPDGRSGYCNLTTAAYHSGRLREAERILVRALETFEPIPHILFEHALCAARSARPIAEQIHRWERFRQAAPEVLDGYYAGAAAQLSAGNDAKAMQLTLEGLKRFPEHQGLLDLANEIQESTAIVQQAGLSDSTEARKLLKRFESLGWSCEFGIVQRRFGLEQLGLLRFTNMSEKPLIKAFEDKFKGFADSTQIKIIRNESKEYLLHVLCYEFGMHTYIYDDHVNVSELQARMARQLSFLRTKLLDDLATGEKIFVQVGSPQTSTEDLQRLATEFRKSSASPLLFVRVGTQDSDTGTITEIAPRILLGYISRRGIWPEHQDIAYAEWLSLCKRVADYFGAENGPPTTEHEGKSFELYN